jgi:hypothetical protein
LPLKAKITIAKDILKGSVKLNMMGFVNRDNNKGNFFIHEENNIYSAVVGDLGGYTSLITDALAQKPFGPGLRSAPPDLHKAYYENRLTEEDLLSCHTYALGRLFYFLLFEEDAPWIADFKTAYPLIKNLYKDRSNPEVVEQIEHYMQKVLLNTKPRIDELTIKLDNRTIDQHELFEYCILHMLSPDPSMRRTNTYWLKVFSAMEEDSTLCCNIQKDAIIGVGG